MQRYANRPGGYTRIIRTGHRYGDAADMCLVEYIDREGELRKSNTPFRIVSEDAESEEEIPRVEV